MQTIDLIVELIDLMLELRDLNKPDAAKELWDPVVFPPSLLEEKLVEKKKELKFAIEAKKQLISQYLEE
jgi:hypothetical protein